jgi:hypothetical protein
LKFPVWDHWWFGLWEMFIRVTRYWISNNQEDIFRWSQASFQMLKCSRIVNFGSGVVSWIFSWWSFIDALCEWFWVPSPD